MVKWILSGYRGKERQNLAEQLAVGWCCSLLPQGLFSLSFWGNKKAIWNELKKIDKENKETLSI